MRGEVTREGAAAEQKSVVLPGAAGECGHETRCHFVYGLIVKYNIESSDFFSASNRMLYLGSEW